MKWRALIQFNSIQFNNSEFASPSVDTVVDNDNFGSAGEPKWNPPDVVAPLVAIFFVADGEFTFAGAPNLKPPLAVVLLDANGVDVPN